MKCLLVSCVLLLATCPGVALAQEDSDLAALQVADTATAKPETASNWRMFVEGALGESILRDVDAGADQPAQRATFDVRYDNTFAPGCMV